MKAQAFSKPCLIFAAALLLACGGDDDSSDTNNTGPTTDPTDASTSGEPTTSATMTSTTMTSTTMTSTTEPDTDPGTSTAPGSESTDPDTTGSESGGGMCPAEPDDDACSTCTKTNCCPELMECQADPDCDCAVQCISDMGIGMMQACLDMCMLDAIPDEGNALLSCVATSGCLAMGC